MKTPKINTILRKTFSAFVFLLAVIVVTPNSIIAQDIITVKNGSTINLEGASHLFVYNLKGMNVSIKGADVNDVTYEVFIRANENAMLKNFGGGRLNNKMNDGALELYFNVNDTNEFGNKNTSWIKSLFTSSTKYESVIKEAKLTLTVPHNLFVKVHARYSNISVSELDKNVELKSRSGDIDAQLLNGDLLVDNDYGSTKAMKIKGSVKVNSRSSTTELKDISGQVKISSHYSTIRLENIKGSVELENKSGSVRAENLERDFDHRGNYTTIKVKNVAGVVTVNNTSGSFEAEHIGSVSFRGNYSDMQIEDVLLSRQVTLESKSSSLRIKKVNAPISVDGSYMKMDIRDVNGAVNVYNKSGSIHMEKVTGDIRIDGEYNAIDIQKARVTTIEVYNRSGEIRAELVGESEAITFRNRYGNVNLKMNKQFFGSVNLESRYGEIKHNFNKSQVVREIKNDSDSTVEIKANGKAKVDIRVENGNISIQD